MFCCVCLKILMQVFFFSCEETSVLRVILQYSSPTAFSRTRNPQVDSTEKKIAQDNCRVPYFHYSELFGNYWVDGREGGGRGESADRSLEPEPEFMSSG